MQLHLFDKFKRYQKSLSLIDFAPSFSGYCACGCGEELSGRKKRWASYECSEKKYIQFAILKGNVGVIRKELFKIDEGFCRKCGVYDEEWQADHIVPVALGGGASTLLNFQTLCLDCHKEKTKNQVTFQRRAISSQFAVKAPKHLLYAPGEESKLF